MYSAQNILTLHNDNNTRYMTCTGFLITFNEKNGIPKRSDIMVCNVQNYFLIFIYNNIFLFAGIRNYITKKIYEDILKKKQALNNECFTTQSYLNKWKELTNYIKSFFFKLSKLPSPYSLQMTEMFKKIIQHNMKFMVKLKKHR